VTIGASIFVIVVGAILYFAADVHVAHVGVNRVGLILMIAGVAGLVLGLIQQAIWSKGSRREVSIEDSQGPKQPPH
jgi:hypothetical protein